LINIENFRVKFSLMRPSYFLFFYCLSFWGLAFAQSGAGWSDRPIKIFATSPPGGTIDLLSRMVASECSQSTGKSFIVENRVGAGGTIGATAVAKANADGYTLFLGSTATQSIAPAVYKNLPMRCSCLNLG
jgi:tripartite-type tricarboxylate transporter receptor subunit TctC